MMSHNYYVFSLLLHQCMQLLLLVVDDASG
jgi:hypothetical protein